MTKNSKSSLLVTEIKQKIIDGSFGNSVERFLTVRELANEYSISLVTAQKIIKRLSELGVITLYGKAYFITTGKISPESQLQIRIHENHQITNKFIGIHIPKFDNPFFAALLNEVTKFIYKQGFTPLVMCSNKNPDCEKNILKNFIKIGVCGVVSCPNNSESLQNLYENYPLPLVFLAEHSSLKDTYFAGVNNDACAQHVAHHLIEMVNL